MKQIISSFIIVLFMILLFIVQVSAAYGEGTSFSDAFVIKDMDKTMEYYWRGTNVYHKFTAPFTGYYTIKISGGYPMTAKLYDSEQNYLDGISNSWSSDINISRRMMEGETYYIRTYPTDTESQKVLCSLNITGTSADGKSKENPLTLDNILDDIQVSWDGNGVYYIFNVITPGTYTFQCDSTVPITISARDKDYEIIEYTNNNNPGATLVVKLKAGTNYLYTHPIDTKTEAFDYVIRVSYTYTKTADDYEIQINSINPDECVIVKYNKAAKNAIIPETLDGRIVTELLSEAFKSISYLESVSIPSTVKKIGKDCFYGCTKLKEVLISEGLETIGAGAFERCGQLKSVQIPKSVESLGASCFERCSSLETVEFADDGLIQIGSSCFRECTSLEYITIPASVTTMGTRVFQDCSNLEGITFLNTLETLPSSTFLNCGYLCSDKIIWPKGLKVIGSQAFRNCDSFITLIIPDGVTRIDDHAFYACQVNELVLPFSLIEIGGGAFNQCNICDPLVIPEGVISIGGNAFTDNTNLEEVIIPSTVQNIGSNAFRRCKSLSSAVFYTTDVKIAENCFKDASLVTMYVYPDSDPLKFAKSERIPYEIMQEEADDESSDNDNGEYIPPEENVQNTTSAFLVYEPKYGYVNTFTDDYTTVYHNGVYSVIDAWNNQHNQSEQDEVIGNYAEDIVAVFNEINEEITFHNRNGYSFTLQGYVWCDVFKGGKCAVMNSEGLYGMIDKDGNVILDCLFEDIQYDTSDTLLVYAESGWTSITLGQSTYSLRANSKTLKLYDPVLSVTGEHMIASDGTGYAILTSDQSPLTDFQYDLICDAHNGLFIGYYDDFVDLIQLDGTITATLSAYYVGEYSENKIAVYDGAKFYYVDKSGNTILNVNVDNVVSSGEFHESFAVVKVNGKGYTYIDISGNIAVDSYWDYAARFAHGYALVMNYHNDNDGNSIRKWSIIDKNFNTVITLDDDVYIDSNDEHSMDFSNGYIRTINRETGLMGFVRFDPQMITSSIKGDYDCNGIVEIADAAELQKALLGKTAYNENAKYTCDINEDGRITAIDIALIYAAALGMYQIVEY